MRYNPATDQARNIDAIAAECKAAIKTKPAPLVKPRDVFAAESCRIWAMCRQSMASVGDRVAVASLDALLATDMHVAMHHRPHQREF